MNDDVEIKDLQRNDADFNALKIGSMIKLKGRSENSTGLVPIQIKMRQTFGFNIEEIKGKIEAVDLDKNTFRVMGIEVIANEKTAIETL